ncbi:Fe-S-containing protein [Mesocricetibacter intestinalis]|uniref:Fe-S-containing protein n=1 Tax=Mesocricetibacter intestinalis TaxID=1521930 RepID=UPI001060C67F|nr:Fe-S-containing protein [Mesocricetibacter intestinalis]
MTYFFISLLQALLPSALLLGCSWHAYSNAGIKTLSRLSLGGLLLGVALGMQLKATPSISLSLNLIILISLILFFLCQFIHSYKINKFWHFILILIAAVQWTRDPNIAAITGTDVVNTDFILHISALIAGLLFCIFSAGWIFILLNQVKKQQKTTALSRLFLALLLLLVLIPVCGEIVLGLMKLQLIELTKARLSFAAKSANIKNYFNYISALLLMLGILFFAFRIHSTRRKAIARVTDPIEKRKKIAAAHISGKIIGWGLSAVMIITGSQIYWDKVASQPPRLSEAVQLKLDTEKNLHIPIEQVKDGNLHRFLWVADDGKAVRFFVINRQPERLSLAVVFDACLLCGDQGYVMQDNQVVCVGCGVRIFTPSIGKPGGCNPVPIEDWRQTETEILISKSSLEDGLNLFSTVIEIEVRDPVNGAKLKNTTTEYKYSYEDKTYFFADEKNLELFKASPENYLQEENHAD